MNKIAGASPKTYEEAMSLPPGPKANYALFSWPLATVALTPAGLTNFYGIEEQYGIPEKHVMDVKEFMERLRLSVHAAGNRELHAHVALLPDGPAKGWLYAIFHSHEAAVEDFGKKVCIGDPAAFAQFVAQTAVGDQLQEDEESIRHRKMRWVADREPRDVVHDRHGVPIHGPGQVYGPEVLHSARQAKKVAMAQRAVVGKEAEPCGKAGLSWG